jgi:hypothetical protein
MCWCHQQAGADTYEEPTGMGAKTAKVDHGAGDPIVATFNGLGGVSLAAKLVSTI